MVTYERKSSGVLILKVDDNAIKLMLHSKT